MGQAEVTIFIILANVILLIFIIGIVIFIFQYRRRKLLYEKEKQQIHERHSIELLNTQIEMQQQTMHHIGREIHDNVGQKLTLAALYAQQMEFLNRFPEINPQIANISSIINESLADLRSLSKSLTDTTQEDIDLRKLIQSECDRVNALGMCRVRYEITGNSLQTSLSVKQVVVRILQEFIQNSLKHAACTEIVIITDMNETDFTITAADNGKGFDRNVQKEKSGIGLTNMERRAQLINADFVLSSKMGVGTNLKICIPLQQIMN